MHTTGQPYRRRNGISGSFDAIVIGSGMGGMSAAVMLAKQNKSVLILEQNAVVGGLTQTYTRGGYRWNTGLHYVGNVHNHETTTGRLFDYITDGQVDWIPMPDTYNTMVIGDKSYPIPAGKDAYSAAMKDYFPEEADAIDRYMDLVPQVAKSAMPYFGQKVFPESIATAQSMIRHAPFHDHADRTTLEALQDLGMSAALIAVICANWGDYSSPPHRSSFAMHCMLVQHYMNGGSYPRGGAGVLADTMMPIVEAAGGKVLHSAEVEQILVDDGRAVGVRLAGGEEVTAPILISNAGVQNTFGRLMPGDHPDAAPLRAHLDTVDDSYGLVGINLGLRADAATLGLESANIWAHPSSDFAANLDRHKADFNADFPWAFITFPSVKDPDWAQAFPGKSTIEMYAYTFFDHFAGWAGTSWRKRGADYDRRKADIERRLLDMLERFVPDVRDYIDICEVSTPLTYETFTKRERGGFMGVESTPARFQQAWLRATTPLKGLYLTGQDVATDGMIGALTGGILCASAILGRDMMSDIMTATAEKGQQS